MSVRLISKKVFQRYVLYIVPIAIVLAIPILVSFLRDGSTTIAGTDEKRFWITIEAIWLIFWLCKLAAFVLPKAANKIHRNTSVWATTCNQLLQRLGTPISLVLWLILCQFVFAWVSKLSNSDLLCWCTSARWYRPCMEAHCAVNFEGFDYLLLHCAHGASGNAGNSYWPESQSSGKTVKFFELAQLILCI